MFNQNVYSVLFISLGLVSTLRTNSLGMNNTMNDISFRQHARGYYGNGESFSQYKTSTILDILVSQRKQSHINYSIFLMNSHLCSMHVSNSAVFFRTSNLWQLHWKTWQIYKSVNILFSEPVLFWFFFSWSPYHQHTHRVYSLIPAREVWRELKYIMYIELSISLTIQASQKRHYFISCRRTYHFSTIFLIIV